MLFPLRSNAHLIQLETAFVLKEAVVIRCVYYSSWLRIHPTSADRAEKQEVIKEKHTQKLRRHSSFFAQTE